jgi:hypothetical protein
MPNSKNRVVTKKEDCISWEQSKYWWLNCIACSEASMTTQMRGFGFVEPSYEQAIHAFSGGFMNLGHACGLLTGAALATGFLARSLFNDEKKITEATLYTAIQITNEYPELSGSIDCRDITGISVATHNGRFKYLKQGKAKMCGRLHIKWAPQAHDLIEKSLTEFESFNSSKECTNCAVLTMKNLVNRGIIRKEDSMLVAGMAGGVGLSGNVCGALAAGIFALATHSYL